MWPVTAVKEKAPLMSGEYCTIVSKQKSLLYY
jgi:hypothetical protein